jgi:hypothetical protein
MLKKTKVALFVGSDISSQLLLNRLVPEMQKNGYEPIVYLPRHNPSKKILPRALQDLAFYERRMTAEVIYPFLNNQIIQDGASNYTPEQLSVIYSIGVHEVGDINAPNFIRSLHKDPNLAGGISIRCYQKFGEAIISMFDEKGFLWNLHPGILPEYRGVMTLVRAMANGDSETSYSLHVIDKNWDAGALLDMRPEPLDRNRPMLSNYCSLAPSGVPIITEALEHFFSGRPTPPRPQDPSKARYWTFPTSDELKGYEANGVTLVDCNEMPDLYMKAFEGGNITINDALRILITDAIDQWQSKPLE